MSWQKYDLVFQLLAPMHIGWRKTSNLQQTRGYVTGKVLWAALTARLTREAGKGADGNAYNEIGGLVQDKFRFTYLYPATQNDDGYKLYYPWQDDFDYLFLDSYSSTALNYINKSAADGLLHETEFIAPHTRTGQQVYLSGSLYVKDDLPASLDQWQSVLNRLQFGGERGYGWGRVQLVSELRGMPAEPVGLPVNGRILAHLQADSTPAAKGLIEPLLGWERNSGNNDTVWKLSKAVISYAPGAKVDDQDSFQITDYGLWR